MYNIYIHNITNVNDIKENESKGSGSFGRQNKLHSCTWGVCSGFMVHTVCYRRTCPDVDAKKYDLLVRGNCHVKRL